MAIKRYWFWMVFKIQVFSNLYFDNKMMTQKLFYLLGLVKPYFIINPEARYNLIIFFFLMKQYKNFMCRILKKY